jgi:Tetratricopeptide repeat
MMIKLKIKNALLYSVFSVVFLLFSFAASSAEEKELTETSILSLYEKYEQARYAVQWKVPTGDISELRARMRRQSYLMYYTSDNLLANPQGPFVQFGFFKNVDEAEQFVDDNKAAFSGLRVVSVSREEHAALMLQVKPKTATSSQSKLKGVYWLSGSSEQSGDALKAVMSEAKELYMNKQYDQALEYYSALSLVPDPNVSIWARELKGLTEERLGRSDRALATYRELVVEGTSKESWYDRVNQRLRALETAADDDKDALRKSKYNQSQSPFYYRGAIGQSYNYVTVGGKNLLDRDVLSIISTNLDTTAGYRTPDHEVEARVSGFSNYDLLDYPENYRWGKDNRTQFKRAQVDYTHVKTGTKATGGRQQDYDSGVYMYFDGLSVKYPFNKKITLGANAGVPVQFSDFYDSLDRQFFSAQASYDHNKYWRMAGYLTHQTLYGEIDRAAWGGRLQYNDQRFSSYLNLDYDYEFAELNIFRWNGSYKLSDRHQVSANYGLQRSPFLTSTNILLGQPFLNVEDYLRDQLNQEYLLYNALLRTGVYEYGSASYQFKVDDELHITTDIYHSVSSEMPIFDYDDDWISSTVVTKGAEFRYSAVGIQAVATDFLGINDTATLSYRHGDTTLSSSNWVQFSERLRLWNDKIFVIPKMNLRYTTKKETDTSRTNLRGAVALMYKPWRNVELRMEAGNEAVRYVDEKNSVDQTYLFVGYQARF